MAGVVAALPVWAELLEADPTELTSAERTDGLLALAALSGQVDAALGRFAGAVDAHGDHSADGAPSVSSWLAGRTELDHRRSSGLVARARDLRSCPELERGFRSGRLGTAKVQAALRVREGVEGPFAADEEDLVAAISPLTVARALIWLRRWREGALAQLPCSPEDPPLDDPSGNELRLTSTFEGNRVLDGSFTPIIGAEVEGLLEAEVNRRFHAGEFRADDGLSQRQRNAIALVDLLRRGSSFGSDGGESRRTVTILVDLNRLLGLEARSVEELLQWPCELADGTAVPLAHVLETMADATISTVLGCYGLGGTFHPVGEITTQRHANASQRRQLRVRDQGCRWPGCGRPARWTQAHHEPPWEEVHQTSVPCLVLLCSFHHHQRHDHGYRLTLDPGGTLHVRRPDDRPLPVTVPGHQIEREPRDRPSRFTALTRSRWRGPPSLVEELLGLDRASA